MAERPSNEVASQICEATKRDDAARLLSVSVAAKLEKLHQVGGQICPPTFKGKQRGSKLATLKNGSNQHNKEGSQNCEAKKKLRKFAELQDVTTKW